MRMTMPRMAVVAAPVITLQFSFHCDYLGTGGSYEVIANFSISLPLSVNKSHPQGHQYVKRYNNNLLTEIVRIDGCLYAVFLAQAMFYRLLPPAAHRLFLVWDLLHVIVGRYFIFPCRCKYWYLFHECSTPSFNSVVVFLDIPVVLNCKNWKAFFCISSPLPQFISRLLPRISKFYVIKTVKVPPNRSTGIYNANATLSLNCALL